MNTIRIAPGRIRTDSETNVMTGTLLTMNAVSLTDGAKRWLKNPSKRKILHIFDDVCNLINADRDVLSIVNPEIGNGPFNLVLEESFRFSNHLNIDDNISVTGSRLTIGNLTISLSNAQRWNPVFYWEALRSRKEEISSRLKLLPFDSENETLLRLSLSLSRAIIHADLPSARNSALKLAGLGIGLTPAGDDILMGAMHATWIVHPQITAESVTQEMARAAASLTTSLSGAWLQSAARGEAGAVWHELFNAFIHDENIYAPLSKILSVGETSGSDALTGFLSVFSAL